MLNRHAAIESRAFGFTFRFTSFWGKAYAGLARKRG